MKQMSSKQPLSVYWLWERLLSECLSTVGENRLPEAAETAWQLPKASEYGGAIQPPIEAGLAA